MEEYFDALDENGNLTGVKKLRKEVHRDGDWHRTVHIWIINNDNESYYKEDVLIRILFQIC